MISIKDDNTPLVAAFEDEISQEANSDYKLSFKYPAKHEYRPLIKKGIILEADDLHGTQLFRVFEITKRHGYINVYANQVADDLNGYAIDSISVDRVQGMTVMAELSGSIKREHPFSFFSDIEGRHTFNQADVSVMDALSNGKHSIMGQWGGELVRDKYQVNLLKKAGKDTETLFMYKKNLKYYEETDTIKGLVSILHLVAEVDEQQIAESASSETQTTTTTKKIIRVTVESNLKDTHPIIVEKTIKVQDQDVKTVEDLTAYGRKYFERTLCDVPGNSLKIDVTNNYEGSVRLFDTAIVFHEVYDRDLRMQITGYKFSPMANRLKSISFGEIKTNLAKQISSQIDNKVAEATAQHDAVFEAKLQKQIDNANRVFDSKETQIRQEIEDGIKKAEASAEVKVADVNAKVLEAEKLAKEVDERLKEFLNDAEIKQKEFEETLRNLSLPEEAIKKITEAIKVDDIPSIKQSFDDLKNKVSETSEESRLTAEILGNNGKTRYNKNLLVGDPNRTKSYDEDFIELEANDGGFRRGETYTISFSQTCELLQKVAITLTQANNKGVKLVLTPTKAKMEAQTFNLSKDKEVISVYPLSYRAALTGDWYKSKQMDLNAAEVQDLALEMSYRDVVDSNNASLILDWSPNPDVIFDGNGGS
ncbi:phage tail protein [Streptococcus equi subsp. zooepidemicus]|uniref:Phage endopeptidase n=1 Tax=Streptococcus equi subsp. zooepidemicus TaxID=40041 RepID=A0AAJ1PKS0_STRSZ|nr:phage tail spike protein [Streptococcus equi]MCD3390896.1 phage tail protein [Streptococcus equi subsp. zooepidemicus]MCD3422923.1 phage tail protein [Streptococcus equi subsp. zooepidemicus]MCD3433933.1 phage tail protein [Streptococcus equi subsp. zooepidemicus]MDI5917308.1 phage tail spike protein [Streptococcus equi subsp. zooepidemicus]MDI5955261.1 phage tail spike protein [Streptococcus equi subsp. zooepidemicus]